jgi:hypothetical protein
MLIVFDSKSSLIHYTFNKVKFLSQLHICIILCHFCKNEIESLMHLFYRCHKIKHVLDELKHIFNSIFEKKYSTCWGKLKLDNALFTFNLVQYIPNRYPVKFLFINCIPFELTFWRNWFTYFFLDILQFQLFWLMECDR